MYCQKCGADNSVDDRFCGNCGYALVAASTTPHNISGGNPSGPGKGFPRDSGAVTAMSVVGFVFGLIGMMGSFVPCLGSLAFYVGIPAAIISGIALAIASSQDAKKSFAIVALTVSLIGVTISGWQYFSIIAAGNRAQKEMQLRRAADEERERVWRANEAVRIQQEQQRAAQEEAALEAKAERCVVSIRGKSGNYYLGLVYSNDILIVEPTKGRYSLRLTIGYSQNHLENKTLKQGDMLPDGSFGQKSLTYNFDNPNESPSPIRLRIYDVYGNYYGRYPGQAVLTLISENDIEIPVTILGVPLTRTGNVEHEQTLSCNQR